MTKREKRILIVDDEESIVFVLKKLLEDEFIIDTASEGQAALQLINEYNYFAVFLDIRIPKINGMEILSYSRELANPPNVIIMTAQNTMINAIDAMKKGAYDYITKPFDVEEIVGIIKKIRKDELDALPQNNTNVKNIDILDSLLVGKSKVMQEIFKTIGKLSHNSLTVLILGESGTGKELVARAIHLNSLRNKKPFIVVNTPSVPFDLLESELFGHEKGSFTGANEKREGKFLQANGGTIFLDEIGDMPLDLQAKLLRVIQEKEVEPVGSNKSIKIDVRIIAATNRNLKSMIKESKFREDLYYRLNVIEITLPPLRDRKSDIPVLANFFIEKFAKELGISGKQLNEESLSFLQSHNFPGNIRELENAIRRTMIMSHHSTLTPEDFYDIINPETNINSLKPSDKRNNDSTPFEDIIRQRIKNYLEKIKDTNLTDVYKTIIGTTEKIVIEEILILSKNNQIKASNLLGINRNTLRKKIKEFNISKKII
ncbi:MAG: sigma-54-dependent Fis family transcriptional regulator [Candidatus Acididesulfobacter guangdongensis]|uniref:DNA-binding transcriptional regulator NtrC n=1 Tax=Acididesulfobacter guangdongensis TaxID=2597225 RepID=A0A519BIB3_ACIG2|nr:MAG: sigma-54-dependent Fis family transcriptional regulator [Candidatus Acididesulfobacter guangdongensis]